MAFQIRVTVASCRGSFNVNTEKGINLKHNLEIETMEAAH